MSQKNREYNEFPMESVENGIFLAKVKVSQADINRIGKVKYFYKKMNIGQSKWWESDTVKKYKRGWQFLEQDFFFDFIQPQAKLFKDQNEIKKMVHSFMKYLIARFNQDANAETVIKFVQFCALDQIRAPVLEYLFELLLEAFKEQERQIPVVLKGIKSYIIEIISVLD